MRKQDLGMRDPAEIPVAGVTLRDLMFEQTTPDIVRSELSMLPSELLRDDDEVWRFKMPTWTWQNMSGVAGFVVLRGGLAAHWLLRG